jgi:transposase
VDAIGDLVAEAVRIRAVEGHVGVSRPTVIAWRARYEESGSADWSMGLGRAVRAASFTARSFRPR